MPPWLILALKIAANVAAIILGIWMLWPALRPRSTRAPAGRDVEPRTHGTQDDSEGRHVGDDAPEPRERPSDERSVGE